MDSRLRHYQRAAKLAAWAWGMQIRRSRAYGEYDRATVEAEKLRLRLLRRSQQAWQDLWYGREVA